MNGNWDKEHGSLREALAALAREDAGRAAPLHVEAGLVRAFRARGGRRPRPWLWAAAAAAGLAAAVFLPQRIGMPELPLLPAPVATAPPVDLRLTPPVQQARRARPRRVRAPEQREVATDFLPLPYGAPMDPDESATVVRVSLPPSAMTSLGLPVQDPAPGFRINADVVLGRDGLAKAIRFVRTTPVYRRDR